MFLRAAGFQAVAGCQSAHATASDPIQAQALAAHKATAESIADVTYTSVASGATKLLAADFSSVSTQAGVTFSFNVKAVDSNNNLDPSNGSHITLTPEAGSGDFVRTARAKGLAESSVMAKHVFRNALIPVVTIVGTDFGSYLSGSVLTETIFGWPGLGRYIVQAIMKRDFPVIQGSILFMAVLFVVVNLLVDVSYGLIDPRIRQRGA